MESGVSCVLCGATKGILKNLTMRLSGRDVAIGLGHEFCMLDARQALNTLPVAERTEAELELRAQLGV